MAQLTLKQANTIVEKALAKAREMKIKPLGVVVLDTGGHLVSAQREDGASMFRLDVAINARRSHHNCPYLFHPFSKPFNSTSRARCPCHALIQHHGQDARATL